MALLRHPVSFEYESLAYYFNRVAVANHCNEGWLLSLLRLERRTTLDRLNFLYDTQVLETFSELTGVNLEKLLKMTVHIFSFGLWNAEDNFYLNRLITKSKIKFCPVCLKEKYYERIYWSHNFIKICTKHNVILLEECTGCKKTITRNEFISGKCTCGKKLIDNLLTFCEDSFAIANQKWVYSILEIDNDLNIVDKLVNVNLSKDEYIKLFDLLNGLYETYMKNYENKSVNKQENFILCYEKVLKSWPDEFYSILDEVNKKLYFLDKEIDNDNIIYNPIRCISSQLDNFERIDFLINTLWGYFLKSYNSLFFIKALDHLIIDNKFISIINAQKIFNTSITNIKNSLLLKVINGNEVIELDEILNIIISFFKRGEYYIPSSDWKYDKAHRKDKNGFNSINMIFQKIRRRKISFYAVLEVVEYYNLEVKIYPYYAGFGMIFLNENFLIDYFTGKQNNDTSKAP